MATWGDQNRRRCWFPNPLRCWCGIHDFHLDGIVSESIPPCEVPKEELSLLIYRSETQQTVFGTKGCMQRKWGGGARGVQEFLIQLSMLANLANRQHFFSFFLVFLHFFKSSKNAHCLRVFPIFLCAFVSIFFHPTFLCIFLWSTQFFIRIFGIFTIFFIFLQFEYCNQSWNGPKCLSIMILMRNAPNSTNFRSTIKLHHICLNPYLFKDLCVRTGHVCLFY